MGAQGNSFGMNLQSASSQKQNQANNLFGLSQLTNPQSGNLGNQRYSNVNVNMGFNSNFHNNMKSYSGQKMNQPFMGQPPLQNTGN